jgi:hypothetical protein
MANVSARFQDRGAQDLLAEEELVVDCFITRKVVRQRTENRLRRRRSLINQPQQVRHERLAGIHSGQNSAEVSVVEDTPRRQGELHHGEQRRALRKPYEKLLIQRGPIPERGELAATTMSGQLNGCPIKPWAMASGMSEASPSRPQTRGLSCRR